MNKDEILERGIKTWLAGAGAKAVGVGSKVKVFGVAGKGLLNKSVKGFKAGYSKGLAGVTYKPKTGARKLGVLSGKSVTKWKGLSKGKRIAIGAGAGVGAGVGGGLMLRRKNRGG